MADVFGLALPFFGLIALGFLCGRIRRLPEDGMAWMNFFLIYLALPALFFRILARTPLEQINRPSYVLATAGATALVFALGFLAMMLRGEGTIRKAAVSGVASAYGNIGYMGPGLALSTIGPEAAAPVALIFCFDSLLLFSIVPFFMAIGAERRPSLGAVIAETATRIVTHPFIIATVVGILAAFMKFEPPQPLDRLLTFLQSAAAPVALFALGVTVALRYEGVGAMARVARRISPVLMLKLLIHPALVIALLLLAGPFDSAWVSTAALMASLPPALNVFIIARQYETWVEEASNAVLLGTLMSVVTLTTMLYLVRSHALP